MDLYTRCPHCQTTFRVTTQQLQASGGQVRCGFCGQVFDAFATLTAQGPPQDRPDSEELQEPVPVAAVPAPAMPKPGDAVPDRKIATATPVRADPAAALYEWEFRMPAARQHTGLWFGLSALLCAGLLIQAVYTFRSEITIRFPQARELYSQVCAGLGCDIPQNRFSGFLHIEASDLQAVDPAVPNEIELIASIRNRAPIDLAYPAFELTLTDAVEQTIARRVFLPPEYLSADAAGMLKAGSEVPVHLFLDTGSLRAAGYRLYLFYP